MKSFKRYIIESESAKVELLVPVDDMVYGTPNTKHRERMNERLNYFNPDIYDLIKVGSPPSNGSQTTKDEIRYIDSLAKDEALFKKYDEHFSYALFDYASENDLEYDQIELTKIKREASNVILHAKFHFNRPRPAQLAKVHGMELKHMRTESGHTPSYPSSHAAQSRLLALLIADNNPEHKDNLIKIADEIAHSREVGGIHYPSDNEFGKKIADIMHEELTKS